MHGGLGLVCSGHMLFCIGLQLQVEVLGSGGELWLMEVRVIPENPVSILSGDVTGCE